MIYRVKFCSGKIEWVPWSKLHLVYAKAETVPVFRIDRAHEWWTYE